MKKGHEKSYVFAVFISQPLEMTHLRSNCNSHQSSRDGFDRDFVIEMTTDSHPELKYSAFVLRTIVESESNNINYFEDWKQNRSDNAELKSPLKKDSIIIWLSHFYNGKYF